ncbi:MAG: trigger factor [Actinobacteria bacterium]|nr:trigger factor [Actinomycetota bacterium]
MQTTEVHTSSERIGKDRVKLRVEVPEASLAPALAAAYRKWAHEIRVPGFRKGKIPRQIIDARVGADTVREEALREALPDFYSEAMDAEELQAIAPPDIEVIELTQGAPVVFEATVDVRPEINLPDIGSLTVEAPPSEVNDADVSEQLDRLRDRFAELEAVSREARRGDFVLIDLNGMRDGEPVEGAGAPDLLYELGSRTGPPKLDDELEGNRPGAILRFTDSIRVGAEEAESGALPDGDISFTVLLKEVKTKRLPPLNDEFAKTVGEFDSLDELREDLRERLGDVKLRMVSEEIGRLVLDALVRASDLEPPEKLVDTEFEHRLHHFEEDLERAGIGLESYAREVGSTVLEVRSELRAEAAHSVVAELLLEDVARREDIEVAQDDLGREVGFEAARTGRAASEVAEEMLTPANLRSVAAAILRRKAVAFVVEHANVIGRPHDGSTVEAAKEQTPASEAAEEADAAVEA